MLAALLGLSLGLAAQRAFGSGNLSVRLTGVDDSRFPQVAAYLAVTDDNGWPLSGLAADHFAVVEGQTTITPKAMRVESVADLPLTAVLALDVSVDKSPFVDVQTAALQFANTLGPNDRVGLLTFADQVEMTQPIGVDVETLKAAIANLNPGGNYTALNDAVAEAARQVAGQEGEGHRAIILITDNVDNAKALGADEALTVAREADVPLFAFGFGKANADVLSAFAVPTGGRAILMARPSELNTQMRLLGLALRQGYRVTFNSTLQADNRTHSFSVLVKAQDLSGEVTANFTARPSPVTVKGPGFDTQQPVQGRVFAFAEVEAASAIRSVEFFLDGQSAGAARSAPYSLDLDISALAPGTHTLVIRATDANGNVGEQETNFIVAEPLPLSVALSASPHQTLEQGATVTLAAIPQTSGQVKRLEFWLDGQSLGVVETAPYTLTLNTGRFAIGEHTALVTVNDSRGQQAQANVTLTLTTPAWRVWLRYAGLGLGWLGVALLAILAPVVSLRMLATQRARIQGLALVELENTGNTRGRFDVKFVDEANNTLSAEFLLHGEKLPGASQRTVTPALVIAAPALTTGGANGHKPAADEPKPKASFSAWGGLVQPVLDLVATLGMMLPGALGQSFARFSSTARQAQYTATSAQYVSSQMKTVGAAGQGAAVSAPVAEPMPAPERVAVATAPSAKPAKGGKPAPQEISGWYQTPEMEAGETLSLHLRLTPRGRVRSQPYPFRVLARASARDDATRFAERGSIRIKGLSFFQRLWPFVVFLIFMGLAVVGAFLMLTRLG